MNLESLNDKHLHEMERLVTELLTLMKKAKLTDDPLYSSLHDLKETAEKLRRERFDEENPRFKGY
jgi:hypothetical protein